MDSLGTGEGFQHLLETYSAALHRLCSVYAANVADQQDLFQEIALALWKASPHFRGDSSVRTWLYRIAHNVAITSSIRVRRKRLHEVQTDELPALAPDVDERREQLLDAVRRLGPIDRELVLLYLEGLSNREIGDVLGMAEGSAAVKLTRVRQRLSAMLLPEKEAKH